MIKLVKYKIETYRNNSNQLNQNWNIDDIELNINANHYKKVLKENNYVSEKIEDLHRTELQKNLLKLRFICPLV